MPKNFSYAIDSTKLVKGLRSFEKSPRDANFLVESIGAVGRNGALMANETLVVLNTSVIEDSFPYPQIFVFSKITIVCGATTIYEIIDETLTLMLTIDSASGMWEAVDYYDYIYLSNGEVSVKRSASTGTYTEDDDLPVANAICNFNGQVLISPI